MDVRASAAGDDTLFHCRAGSVQSILHAIFCLFHLSLGGCAYTDYRYAARELGQTLLELLSVEIGLGLFDLFLDLSDAGSKSFLVAEAVNDDCIFLLNLDALGAAELVNGGILELKAKVGADNCAACQDRDILKHCFPSVAIAGSLDSNYAESAAQLVDDQSCESLALDILSDDQELRAHLDDLLKKRKDILDRGDLLVCDQDERIVQDRFHLVHIGCHICADVASVELHAFDKVQLSEHCLGLLDGDNAVLGDFLHCVRDHLADLRVAGRDSSYVFNVSLAVYGRAHILNCLDSGVSGFLHTLSEDDRVCACCQVLHTFVDHSLCKDCSCGRAVACDIVCLGGDFLDQLCAHVLKIVLELDLLCDRNAVVSDRRSAVGFVKDNVSALGAQCDLYCIREFVDSGSHCHSGVCAVFEIFCHNITSFLSFKI